MEWVREVLAGADFSDERLRRRAEQFLVDKVQHPSGSVSGSCCDAATAKGAYRLLENERVLAEYVWAPYHRFAARIVAEST